jgi:hypothetical protein
MSTSPSPRARAPSSQTSTRMFTITLYHVAPTLHTSATPLPSNPHQHPNANDRLPHLPNLRLLPHQSRPHAQHPTIRLRRNQIRSQRPNRRARRSDGRHASSRCGRLCVLSRRLQGAVFEQIGWNGVFCCYEAGYYAASWVEGARGEGAGQVVDWGMGGEGCMRMCRGRYRGLYLGASNVFWLVASLQGHKNNIDSIYGTLS